LTKLKDVVRPICEIQGSWLKNLIIGEKVYWDIEAEIENVAPSDWRFREDLIWLKYNYMRIAS
jgi:hypothetical protein